MLIKGARTVVVGLLILASVLSFVPLIEWNSWWIRLLDFARLHFLVALIVLLTALLLAWSGRLHSWAALLIGLGAIGYNAYKLVPYLPFREELAISVAECAEGSRLRVLVANVHRSLEDADELFRIVRDTDPDLFLAVETDPWWDERLSELSPHFAEQIQQVAGTRAAFGMHLFSKYPLAVSEVLLPLDNRVPAITAEVRLPDGSAVSFYGLHPRPPLPFQSTTMRDAQILTAAFAAREAQGGMVIAGDFNAVPWERTFRRMMRVGGLLDPRVGRGYIATYDARTPVLYWPLDHVVATDELGLVALERLPAFGSDHWPVMAEYCHRPGLADEQSAPSLADGDLEEAETAIQAALSQAD